MNQENIKEILKKDRRNLFWKLYRIPWIVIFLILMSLNLIQFYIIYDNVLIDENIKTEINEKITPNEIPISIPRAIEEIPEEIPEEIKIDISPTNESEIFTRENYIRSQRLRMDIEYNLKSSVVKFILSNENFNHFNKEQKEELSEQIIKIIDREFLGWRILNRINN